MPPGTRTTPQSLPTRHTGIQILVNKELNNFLAVLLALVGWLAGWFARLCVFSLFTALI